MSSLVEILLLLGGLFMLTSSVGIFRLPDFYTRLQASTIATTLGLSCFLLAAGFHFNSKDVWIRATLMGIFIFITGPLGGHLLSRVSYFLKIPLWKQTKVDDLKGKTHSKTGIVD